MEPNLPTELYWMTLTVAMTGFFMRRTSCATVKTPVRVIPTND